MRFYFDTSRVTLETFLYPREEMRKDQGEDGIWQVKEATRYKDDKWLPSLVGVLSIRDHCQTDLLLFILSSCMWALGNKNKRICKARVSLYIRAHAFMCTWCSLCAYGGWLVVKMGFAVCIGIQGMKSEKLDQAKICRGWDFRCSSKSMKESEGQRGSRWWRMMCRDLFLWGWSFEWLHLV